MNKFVALVKKYKLIILYFLFGIISTSTNIMVYWALSKFAHFNTVPANIIAWASAVLIAFFTNKFCVFRPGRTSLLRFLYEFFTFVASRAFTGLLDTAIMYLFVDVLGINDILMKIISNIIVIIINYVLAKFLIFAKKRADEEDKNERDFKEKGD